MIKLLTRDAILEADDLPRERVEVPEWGGAVFVRALTAAERDAFEDDHRSLARSFDNFRGRLAAATLCDDDGRPLFSVLDAEALGRKSAAALSRVVDVAVRLNGMSAKDVEDLAGN